MLIREARYGLIDASEAKHDDVGLDEAFEEILGMMPGELVIDDHATSRLERTYDKIRKDMNLDNRVLVVALNAKTFNALKRHEADLPSVAGGVFSPAEHAALQMIMEELETMLVDELGYKNVNPGRDDVKYVRGESQTSVYLNAMGPKPVPCVQLDVRIGVGR